MATHCRGWRVRLGLVLALAWSLSGCQTRPPAPPDLESALQRLAESGYRSQRGYDTALRHEVWSRGEEQLDVSFIAPAASGDAPFPLLVYLPGLGESSSSGAVWRRAWAQAGYAVLSVQPMELTQRIWASPLAREGDFRMLAEKEFSAASAVHRIESLKFALDELRRRARAGDPLYRSADLTRIVLAGFDLGAQTVSLVASEPPGSQTAAGQSALRAMITLSPVPRRTDGVRTTRFGSGSLPVLSITGTEDADPLGLIDAPALRQAPWHAMPPGDKYLLVLAGGTHAMLAGDGLFDPYSRQTAGGESGGAGRKQRRGGRRRGGGNTGDESNLTDSAREPMLLAEASGAGEAQSRRSGAQPEGQRAYDLRQIAAVEDVACAFIDAFVKQDARARQWLAQDAARWLGATALLKFK